ncbi:MAG: virulence RhuM family protein [Dysgonamonadaceae bacterium]|jgi:hypothetical protein|nr:virulence RhuM family protein [Dysgonamonadaceae bacterium]
MNTNILPAIKNEIILYPPDNSIELEVWLEDETVWLSLNQMTALFSRDKSVISRHIKNIFDEEELFKDSVVAKFATTAADGKTYIVDYYNLDVIISVGYRVKSKQGTKFRQWANRVLKDYLLKGHAINQRFLNLENRVTETERKIDFFVKTALPHVEGVFYNGQIFDAYKFVSKCLNHDFNMIFLITLIILQKQKSQKSCKSYENQGSDNIGASLKDLGKKLFAFNKMEMTASELLINIGK